MQNEFHGVLSHNDLLCAEAPKGHGSYVGGLEGEKEAVQPYPVPASF